jgi:predicted MFS family arabinose efflux permease
MIAIAGALSLAVAMGIGRFGFTPLVPLMTRDAGLTLDAAGWIAAGNYAGYLVGAFSAHRIPMSSKSLAVLSLLLTVVFTGVMAAPLGTAGWLAMRFLAGVVSAWAFVATSAWSLGALVDLRKLTWAPAVYAGVGSGIALVGLYCLLSAAHGASAASLWIQLGVLGAVLSGPVLLVHRRTAARSPGAPATARNARAATPPGTRGLLLCYGAFGYGYILPATFLPVLARSVLDVQLFGLAWPVFGLTAAVSTLSAGALLRRWSRLQIWASAQLLMGVGVLLPSLWLSAVTVTLSAVLVGGTFMVCTMLGVQEIRARANGDATHLVAWMTGSFALGQIAGPITSSVLLRVPALATHGLSLALQVATLVLVVSGGWLWRQAQKQTL